MSALLTMTAKLPQLAKGGDPDTIQGAIMEPKLDGHRMLAFIDGGKARMFARTGVEKTGKLPAVERALVDLMPDGTVLDGEVVHLDEKGGDWAKVQNVLGAGSRTSTTLTFVAFDVLQLMYEDTRGYPLASRRLFLEQLFADVETDQPVPGQDALPIQLIDQRPYEAEAVAELIATGWEGAIVKDPTARYASGQRGHGWVKIKATETVDVVVMGATEGKGKFAGMVGALIFGEYDATTDGPWTVPPLVERGQCSGMTDAERAEFTRMADAGTLVGTVIEVQHMGKMPSGGWRHPQFKRLRTDKRAEECVA